MAQIFDSLKALINPELSNVAAALGEDPANMSKAATTISAGILAKMADKGDTSQIESALREGGKANTLSHLNSIFSGNASSEQEALGNKLVQATLGNDAVAFRGAVSKEAGIPSAAASKLTTMIAAAVAGLLGSRLHGGQAKTSDLVKELDKEKGSFMPLLSANMRNILGLNEKQTASQNKKKNNYNWVIWLILAIVLILLIIFGWRSCRDKTPEPVAASTTTVRTEQPANQTVNNTSRTWSEFTLPNGTKIEAYRNGMEDRIIRFLNSDTYKNAGTDADLRNNWFEFEDIEFSRDSSTQLSEGSGKHISNIATILEAYPDAKIKIAGNADNSGNRNYNMEISKERAERIKFLLEQQGVRSDRIMTEGFGDEFATWPADATASQSAADRDIAFRFVK